MVQASPNTNPYGYGNNTFFPPNANPYNNVQELYNIRDRIDQQIKNAEQYNQRQNQMPSTVNQTFQITPTNQNGSDFDSKYVQSADEVRNALTMRDTIFVNKEMNMLWTKNVKGEIKAYTLTEMVQLDPKDQQILALQKEIDEMKEAMRNNGKPANNGYANEHSKNDKSSKIQRNSSNDAN